MRPINIRPSEVTLRHVASDTQKYDTKDTFLSVVADGPNKEADGAFKATLYAKTSNQFLQFVAGGGIILVLFVVNGPDGMAHLGETHLVFSGIDI